MCQYTDQEAAQRIADEDADKFVCETCGKLFTSARSRSRRMSNQHGEGKGVSKNLDSAEVFQRGVQTDKVIQIQQRLIDPRQSQSSEEMDTDSVSTIPQPNQAFPNFA